MRFDQHIWRIPTDDGLTKWGHPNGFNIVQCERSWSERGLTRGAHHQWSPKRWYEVRRRYDRNKRTLATFERLSEAREWCDGRWIEAVTGKITMLAGPALREP